MGSYVGQLLGAESVLLMSIALVLISTLDWVEGYFDGIDRAAIWHRRVASTGILLLAPHILLAHNPRASALGPKLAVLGALGLFGLVVWAVLPRWRAILPRALHPLVAAPLGLAPARAVARLLGGYERWRALHRTTGVFVAFGFLHGLLDGTPFTSAPALRISYVVVGLIGLAFYVYREFLARWVQAMHDYQVQGTRSLGDGMIEVSLTPVGRALHFAPGQFAMVYLEARDGWHRHPFTISSGTGEDTLRVTVKALGDYTSSLESLLEAGMPAVIGGPHGRFDLRRGTPRQVWVAAGVGVAPFLSWIRSLRRDLPGDVDFFYTSAGPAPFAAEILAAAARWRGLRVHIIDSVHEGRLSPRHVIEQLGPELADASVYMCGPEPMLRAFDADLRRAGVRRSRIHREYFDWR